MHDDRTALLSSVADLGSLDPGDWSDFRHLAHRVLDGLIDYIRDVEGRPVWQPVPDEVKARIRRPVPRAPRPAEEVWQELEQLVLPYATGNLHPRFWGWVHGSGTPVGMLAEMMAAAINANLGGREHAPVYIERQVIDWARVLMGFPESSGGLLVTGTSMGTLLALAVARNSRAEVRAQGLAGLGRQFVVYASREVHCSAPKAVELLGIGRRGCRAVPVDGRYRMDLAALERMVREDRAAGLDPLCAIGTAGTVNTGAIDDLSALAELCAAHGLWFHVDGAFGGLLALSDRLRRRLAGIDRADSVALDFHKWMHVPYGVGCVLVRRGELHRAAFAAAPEYLKAEGRALAGGAPWFADLGPELSRGFLALKVWFTLQVYGTERLGAMVEKNVRQARYLGRLIARSARLEAAAPAPLNVVCFRYRAPGLEDEARIEEINREIVDRLQESGVAAPSMTRVSGRLAIRVAITNHRTRDEDLELFASAVEACGDEIVRAIGSQGG